MNDGDEYPEAKRKTLWDKLWGARSGRIMLGTAGGYLIGLALLPVLSRVYTPTQFGGYTLVQTVASVLAAVLALRYEMAIAIARRVRAAGDLVVVTLLTAAVACIILASLAYAFQDALVPEVGDIARWLWLSPILAFAMMLSFMVNQLSVRSQDYGAIGLRNFVNASGGPSVQTILGVILSPASVWLIIGAAVGQLAGALAGTRRLWARLPELKTTPSSLFKTAKQFSRYPLYLAPAAFLNGLGGQLPLILFGLWYGEAVLGSLGMAQRILALPVALIGTALAQVYLGQVTNLVRQGKLQKIEREFRGTSKRLTAIAVVIGGGVFLISPSLFPTVLGEEWTAAGRYAQALSIMLAAQFIAQPLSQTLLIAQKHRWQIIADAIRLVLATGVLSLAHIMGTSELVAVWMYSVTFASTYLLYFLLARIAVSRAYNWRMPDED